jgi:hypothetical protein
MPTARSLCGVGAAAFSLLLIAHLFGKLEPHTITAVLALAAALCGYWWWELGKR